MPEYCREVLLFWWKWHDAWTDISCWTSSLVLFEGGSRLIPIFPVFLVFSWKKIPFLLLSLKKALSLHTHFRACLGFADRHTCFVAGLVIFHSREECREIHGQKMEISCCLSVVFPYYFNLWYVEVELGSELESRRPFVQNDLIHSLPNFFCLRRIRDSKFGGSVVCPVAQAGRRCERYSRSR